MNEMAEMELETLKMIGQMWVDYDVGCEMEPSTVFDVTK